MSKGSNRVLPGDKVVAGSRALIVVEPKDWRKVLERWVASEYGLPVRFSHYEGARRRMAFAVLSHTPMSQPAPKPHFVRGLD